MNLPFFGSVSLDDLGSILDDIGTDVLPFHRQVREMMSNDDFVNAQASAMKRDALERRIDEAIAEINRIYQRARAATSVTLGATQTEAFAASRVPALAGSPVTDMLSSIIDTKSELKPWIPFYRLANTSGCFSWGQPAVKNAIPYCAPTIDCSWLAPPTIGAGASMVRK